MSKKHLRGRLRAGVARCAVVALSVGLLGSVANAQDTVNLEFWDMIWGPPEYIDAAKDIVAKFNEEHPGIEVEYRSVPWNNWYQTYVTAVGSGTAPDLSTGAGYQAVQLYELGAIRPIDDVIEDLKADGEIDDFLPRTVDTLRYDDHYVALPWGIDIRVNNGGGLFTEDGKADLLGERNVEAAKLLAAMVEDGSVSPASAGYSSGDKRQAFNRGEAAFVLDGPGLIGQAGDQAENIGIVPPLKGPHGDVGTIFWVNNIMVYEQTEHPEETKTFLKWWSKNEGPLWTYGAVSAGVKG